MTDSNDASAEVPAYCVVCATPLAGPWGLLFYAAGIRRSALNPGICSRCNQHIEEGALVELTVLFADLSDFTALTNELGPEKAHEVAEAFLKSASTVIVSREGAIDKYIGDAVMALFNAPIANKRHAELALDAATTIIDDMDVLSRRFRRPLTAQAGIATGWARIGRLAGGAVTAIGAPVNLASRLESHAAAGEIVVDEAVIRLSGRRLPGGRREKLAISGFPAPVHAYRLGGDGRPASAPGTSAGSGGTSGGASTAGLLFALLGAPCAAATLLGPMVVPLGLSSVFAASSAVWLLDGGFVRHALAVLAVAGVGANLFALLRARSQRRGLAATPLERARAAWIVATAILVAGAIAAETWAHARMAAKMMMMP
ncbi:MAG: adenylate/guanylate cyclase domain-containing protein [Elusimicrobia bacterium]|nr:adenylate/guanylate cyclase domain-containing protein [Elusimicrobiota bacterium]